MSTIFEVECMRRVIDVICADVNTYNNVCCIEIPMLVARILRHITRDTIIPMDPYGIDVYSAGNMVIINNNTGIAMYIAAASIWWNSLILWSRDRENNLADAITIRDMLLDYLKIILRYKLDNITE